MKPTYCKLCASRNIKTIEDNFIKNNGKIEDTIQKICMECGNTIYAISAQRR